MKALKGIPGAAGVSKGILYYYEKPVAIAAITDLGQAITNAICKIEQIYQETLSELGEEQAKIFAAYKMILEDKTLSDSITATIDSGKDPVDAVTEVTQTLSAVLASKKSEYMRQRADDILFIGQLLKEELCGSTTRAELPKGAEKVLVAAKELTPVDTMLFDTKRLAGLITEGGGATSHTVILAKSLGIPAVVGTPNIESVKQEKGIAYLDGYTGEFAVNPDGVTKTKFERKIKDEENLQKALKQYAEADATTADNERIQVAINIGSPADLKNTEFIKFDGIGLFRSEFLYSASAAKPTVEQQTKAYKEVIDAVNPNSVTIRTIDVGGDKQLSYLNMKPEENPFLGNRGIRLCLKNEDIFREQLEAILQSAAEKKVQIMLPMITSLSEIETARAILKDVQEELMKKNLPCCENVQLGIMAETPACVIDIDILARHSDFISIGTNDLLQYIMAADRGNADVQELYNPYHLSFLRMIQRVICEGAKNNIPVSVCGDLAANTDFTVLLLGMGLKKFSVPLPMVNRIKYKIKNTKLVDAKQLADKVLSANSTQEIIKIMHEE